MSDLQTRRIEALKAEEKRLQAKLLDRAGRSIITIGTIGVIVIIGVLVSLVLADLNQLQWLISTAIISRTLFTTLVQIAMILFGVLLSRWSKKLTREDSQ